MISRMPSLTDSLLDLKNRFSRNYWYCHPQTEGRYARCDICNHLGHEHQESENGFLCPIQPPIDPEKNHD